MIPGFWERLSRSWVPAPMLLAGEREQKSRSDGGTCPVCVEERPHGILGGSSCDRLSCRASILQDVCSRAATFQFHFVAKCVQQTLWVCDPLLFPWGFLFHTKQRSTGFVLNFKLASPRSLCDSGHLVEKVLICLSPEGEIPVVLPGVWSSGSEWGQPKIPIQS